MAPPETAPLSASPPAGRMLATVRRLRSVPVLGLVGVLGGLAVTAVPLSLLGIYVVSFTLTATPDSAFNVMTIPAMIGLMADGLLCLVAAAGLAASRTRAVSAGYLVGVGIALGAAVLALALVGAVGGFGDR